MFGTTLSFILRIGVMAMFWVFIWRMIDPRTQMMRILRAGLLVAGFLCILAVLRVIGS